MSRFGRVQIWSVRFDQVGRVGGGLHFELRRIEFGAIQNFGHQHCCGAFYSMNLRQRELVCWGFTLGLLLIAYIKSIEALF